MLAASTLKQWNLPTREAAIYFSYMGCFLYLAGSSLHVHYKEGSTGINLCYIATQKNLIPNIIPAEDFSPITVQNGQLQRSSTSPVCFPFSAVEDSLSDDGESFSVALSSGDSFPTGPGGLQIGSDRVGVTILERIMTPPPGINVEGMFTST